MNEKIISIRLNESDLNSIELIKEYLEKKFENLPPKFREVTTTDVFKYVLGTWIRNYNNPEDMIL